MQQQIAQQVCGCIRRPWMGQCRGRQDAGSGPWRLCVNAYSTTPLFGGLVDNGKGAAIHGRRRAPAAVGGQCAPPRGELVAAIAQWITRLDQCRKIASQCTFASVARRQQHRRKTWMRAEREHAASERRDRERCIQCAKPLQQVACCGECARWRRIDKA